MFRPKHSSCQNKVSGLRIAFIRIALSSKFFCPQCLFLRIASRRISRLQSTNNRRIPMQPSPELLDTCSAPLPCRIHQHGGISEDILSFPFLTLLSAALLAPQAQPLPFSARLQERSAIHAHDSPTRLFSRDSGFQRCVS
jgi:hypothetical protein